MCQGLSNNPQEATGAHIGHIGIPKGLCRDETVRNHDFGQSKMVKNGQFRPKMTKYRGFLAIFELFLTKKSYNNKKCGLILRAFIQPKFLTSGNLESFTKDSPRQRHVISRCKRRFLRMHIEPVSSQRVKNVAPRRPSTDAHTHTYTSDRRIELFRWDRPSSRDHVISGGGSDSVTMTNFCFSKKCLKTRPRILIKKFFHFFTLTCSISQPTRYRHTQIAQQCLFCSTMCFHLLADKLQFAFI